MKKVFISHSTEDKEAAEDIVRQLLKSGVMQEEEIFFTSAPKTSIKESSPFADAIAHAYAESSFCFYLLSPSYLKSKNCIVEWGWMLQAQKEPNKTHFVIALKRLKSDDDIPSMLRHLHRFDKSQIADCVHAIEEKNCSCCSRSELAALSQVNNAIAAERRRETNLYRQPIN